MKKYEQVGSEAWTRGISPWEIRGHVDAILALLQSDSISREKAREEITRCHRGECLKDGHNLPWEELNWNQEEE